MRTWAKIGGLGLVAAFAAAGCGSAATPAADATADAGGSDDVAADTAAADVCGQPGPVTAPVGSPANCTGGAHFTYDPDTGLSTFPDDWFTVDDAKSLTGVHVHFDIATMPWIALTPGALQTTYDDLSTLDGWGVNAGIILRFSEVIGDLPSGPTSSDSTALMIWDLDATPPVKIPFEIQRTDDGTTAILWPMRPLVPKHKHGVIATGAVKTAKNGCFAQPPVLSELLRVTVPGESCDPRIARLRPQYEKLLTTAKVEATNVAAAVVFTTQSITEQSVAIAADIKARDYTWKVAPTCNTTAQYRECSGTFMLADYTDGRVVKDGKPVSTGELPVAIWLPLAVTGTANGPYPPVIFGHGLGSDRGQGDALAVRAAPEGFATIAIDAVGHGDHPHAPKDVKLIKIMKFFGVDIVNTAMDGLALRDHWRGSTYDKLQLVRLLQLHNDLDGDGKPDLDMSKLTYLGVSLGGIMGPEFLALTPDVALGVLAVPGGRVSSIVSDPNSIFSVVPSAMAGQLNASDGDVQRYFPVLQTLVDSGDAASYGPYVLRNRLPGSGSKGTNLLCQMVINDEYVSNASNRALYRALDIPVMAPVIQEVGLIPLAPKAPFSGNIAATQTAAMLEFDRVTRDPGGPVSKAEHGNEPACEEALLQDLHFMHTWMEKGVPEILNPYEVMKTGPVPP